jgi:hypothetical protein
MENIIEILEKGLEKHWEIPLTNKYLLNILKMCRKNQQEYEDYMWIDWPND